jgi:hypothetical protein
MRARHLPGAAFLLLAAQGCTTWAQTAEPVPVLLGDDPPPEVRLTLRDGRRFELRGPALAGDSLLGIEMLKAPDRERPASQRRVAVPLGEVAVLETRRPSTTGIMLVAIPAGFAIAYLAGSHFLANAMGD